ncbi:hypothetical protein IA57_08200 [Mangrovimonas yunxiaonensis]|uniref:Uncharacterized protein n=1 Tax=Mangrovimonas yunxiaonensis TaxID=1197477 RepID=A0A084TIB7_9FLAO|nr:hypothetical protein [Mangrovimonas yunxiaonensis]KFB00453.1 hypothetical protein IA57_08200 [Mangrovimonas yunxiaonensis]GGH34655.1 hypothetical protein GCM10011364_00640 [Mangrovimonas yunxiaonensis]
MRKHFLLAIALFVITTVTYSQASMNAYKYVVVESKFDFLNEADAYQLNSLAKFLFEKYGFHAVMSGAIIPEDLAKNNCLGMTSKVTKERSLLKTKLKVELRDCHGRLLFTKTGTSSEKAYKVAYNLALREAFTSFEDVHYAYKPTPDSLEAKDAPQKTVSAPADVAGVTAVAAAKAQPAAEVNLGELYAQEIAGGYQLVDKTPAVVMVLLATPKSDVFMVDGKNAIVYKAEDGTWVLSEKINDQTKTTTLQIKF